MSETIENKIVEMSFDDDDFEKGVKQTLKALQELKKELKLDEAARVANESFKNINSAANSVNFDNLNKAIDKVNDRFSTMGIVATTAVQNITNSILNVAKSGITNLLTTTFQKGWTRATNIDQAEFTLKGMGKSAQEVADIMQIANEAVDGTAFGLDEAARAASQLAASGTQISQLPKALSGISGMAAMTNSDFTSIAEIFETIAGNGRLMTMQLNQFSNRGVNVAADLARYYGMSEAEIRDYVSHGELSFETFYKAISDLYAEHAKEANETYEGSFSNMIAALGRISQPWFMTFRHEFKDVYNSITPVINAFKDAMNLWNTSHINAVITQISHHLQDLFGNMQVVPEFIRNIRTMVYKPFKLVLNTLVQIGQIARTVFDIPTFQQVSNVFEKIGKALRSIKVSIGDAFEGKFHSEITDSIVNAFGGVFAVINMAITGIKSFFQVTAPFWKVVGQGILQLINGAGRLGEFLMALNDRVTTLYHNSSGFFEAVRSFDLIEFFKNFGDVMSGLFGKLNGSGTAFSKFKESISSIRDNGIIATFTSLKEEIGLTGIVSSVFLSIVEKLVKLGSGIKDFFASWRLDGFTEALKGTSWGSKLADNVAKVKKAFSGVDIFSAPFETIKGIFDKLASKMGTSGVVMANLVIILQKVAEGFKKLGSAMSNAWARFKDTSFANALSQGLKGLWDSIKNFKYEGSGLQKFFEFLGNLAHGTVTGALTALTKIISVFKTIGSFVGSGFSYFANLAKNSTLFGFFRGVGDAADESNQRLAALPTTAQKVSESLSKGGESIKNFFQNTFKGWTAQDWIHSIETGILTMLNASLIGMVKNLSSTFKTISGLIGSFKSIVDSFKKIGKDLGEALKSWNGAGKSKTTFKDVANGIKDIAKSILIVASAVFLLALLPQENLERGISAMTIIAVVVGGLTATIGIISKKAGDSKTVTVLSSGIVKLCAGMALIGFSIASLARQPVANIVTAGLVMGIMSKVMLTMFESLIPLISRYSKSAQKVTNYRKMMRTMSSFVTAIGASIMLMGIGLGVAARAGGNPASIAAAGASVIGIIYLLFKMVEELTEMANNGKGSKIVAATDAVKKIASAMNVIAASMVKAAAAVAILSVVDKTMGNLGKSVATLATIMAAVVGVIYLASQIKGKEGSLAQTNWEGFGKAMLAVSGGLILASIAVMLIAATYSKAGPAATVMAVAAVDSIMIMMGVLANLAADNTNLDGISKMILSAAVLMTSIGIVFKLIEKTDPGNSAAAVAGMITVFGSLSALLLVLNKTNLYQTDLNSLSVVLVAMAAAVVSIGVAFKLIEGVDAVGVVAGIMGMMTMFSALLVLILAIQKVQPAQLTSLATTLAAVGASVLMMATAMRQLDGLQTVWKDFAVMAASIAVLTAALITLGSLGSNPLGASGIIISAGALLVMSVSLIALAEAMRTIDQLEQGWKSFAIAAASLAVMTAGILAIAAAGMVVGPGMVAMGVGFKEFAIGLLALVAAATAFCAIVDIWGGSMDVLAGEILVFLETIAAGIGTVGTTLVTSLTLVAKNIIANIVALAPDIADGVMLILDAIVNGLYNYVPDLLKKITVILNEIAHQFREDGGIADAMDNMGYAVAAKLLRSIGNAIPASGNPIGSLIRDFLGDASDEIIENTKDLDAKGQEYVAKYRAGMEQESDNTDSTQVFSNMINGGSEVGSMIGGNLLGSLGNSLSISNLNGASLLSGTTGVLKDVGGNVATEVGYGMGSDLLNGLSDGANITASFDLINLTTSITDSLDGNQVGTDFGTDVVSGINTSMTDNSSTAESGAQAVSDGVVGVFNNGSKQISKKGTKASNGFISNLVSGINDGKSDVNDAVGGLFDDTSGAGSVDPTGQLGDDMADKVKNGEGSKKLGNAFKTMGKEAMSKVGDGFSDKTTIKQVTAKGDKQLKNISFANSSNQLNKEGYEAGKYTTLGLAAGLEDASATGELRTSSSNVASIVLDTIRSKVDGLDIASPSKKTKEIGWYTLLGLINGLKDRILLSKLRKSSAAMGGAVLTGIQNELEIHSPSKKLMTIAKYCMEGFNKGLKKYADSGEIESTTSHILSVINNAASAMNVTLSSANKQILAQFNTLGKQLQDSPTNKVLQNMYATVAPQANQIYTKLSKEWTAAAQLWRSSSEYENLISQRDDKQESIKDAKQDIKDADAAMAKAEKDAKKAGYKGGLGKGTKNRENYETWTEIIEAIKEDKKGIKKQKELRDAAKVGIDKFLKGEGSEYGSLKGLKDRIKKLKKKQGKSGGLSTDEQSEYDDLTSIISSYNSAKDTRKENRVKRKNAKDRLKKATGLSLKEYQKLVEKSGGSTTTTTTKTASLSAKQQKQLEDGASFLRAYDSAKQSRRENRIKRATARDELLKATGLKSVKKFAEIAGKGAFGRTEKEKKIYEKGKAYYSEWLTYDSKVNQAIDAQIANKKYLKETTGLTIKQYRKLQEKAKGSSSSSTKTTSSNLTKKEQELLKKGEKYYERWSKANDAVNNAIETMDEESDYIKSKTGMTPKQVNAQIKKLKKKSKKSKGGLTKAEEKELSKLEEIVKPYNDAQDAIKDYRKDISTQKNRIKNQGFNSVEEIKAAKDALSVYMDAYDEAKSKKKTAKEDIKKLKEEIADLNKEIAKGEKTYWKDWKKAVKETNMATYHDKMLQVSQVYEMFGNVSAQVSNILDASVDKVVDIFSAASQSATKSSKVLISSINSITKALSGTYDTGMNLFSEFSTTWLNPSEFLRDMKDNVTGYDKWVEGLEELRNRDSASDELVDYIESMGFSEESLSQLNMFNKMNDASLSTASNYIKQESKREREAYLKNMEQTLEDYKNWQSDLDKLQNTVGKKGGLTQGMVDELRDMGVEGAKYAKMFTEMTAEEFTRAKEVYAEQARLSTEEYFRTIEEDAAKNSKWKENLSKLTALGFSSDFVAAAKEMGIEGADYIDTIVNHMDDAQREKIMGYYQKEAAQGAADYLETLQQPVKDYGDWIADLNYLSSNMDISSNMLKQLKELGVSGADIVKQFRNMTADQIKEAEAALAAQDNINAREFLSNMQEENAIYQEWTADLEALEKAGLNRGLIKSIMELGPDSIDKVRAMIALVNDEQIDGVNQLNAAFATQISNNTNSLMNQMRAQASDYQEYYQGLASLSGLGVDDSVIRKITEMGVDGLDYIREIAAMSKEEIDELNKYAKVETAITKDTLLMDIQEERKKITEWGNMLQELAANGLNSEVIQELAEQGYESSYETVKAYAAMEREELGEINEAWADAKMSQQKAFDAVDAAVKQGQAGNWATVTTRTTADKLANEFTDIVDDGINKAYDSYVASSAGNFDQLLGNLEIEAENAYNSDSLYQYYTDIGQKAGMSFATAVNDAMADEEAWISFTSSSLGTITKAGSYIADVLVDAYNKEIAALAEKVQAAIEATFKPTTGKGSTQYNARAKFERMAELCVISFSDKLKDSASTTKVQKSAKKMAQACIDAVKDSLDIHSPSRVMGELAEDTVDGYAGGVEDNAYKAGLAADGLTNMFLERMQRVIDGLSMLAEGTEADMAIQPVFDPDNALTGLDAMNELMQNKEVGLNFGISSIDALSLKLDQTNEAINRLSDSITNMQSYGDQLARMESLMATYLPGAAQDIYLDGRVISSYVEGQIINNIARRRGSTW